MEHFINVSVVLLVCLLAPFVSGQGQCHDLDRQACVLMEQANPNMCKDPALSSAACPDYCKLCPLTCYHCDKISDPSNCTAKQLCDVGQQCLIQEVTSSVDGHHDYTLGCAVGDQCDGNGGYSILVGRRDMSVHCCDTDLCNLPVATTSAPTTTTVITTVATTTVNTVCMRDILVLIEDPKGPDDHLIMNSIKNLMVNLVHEMNIGPQANIFEIVLFSGDVHPQIMFDDVQTTTSVLNAIFAIDPNHRTNYVDFDELLDFIRHYAFRQSNGDRPTVPNDVIVFADYRMHGESDSLLLPDMSQLSGDIIIVDIGGNGTATPLDALATDASHVVHASDYNTLYQVKPQLQSLLCK